MGKIHTRKKRAYKLAAHKNHHNFFHGLVKKKGPRTFTSEAKAKEFASKQGMEEEKYQLRKIKKGKRFQIMLKA